MPFSDPFVLDVSRAQLGDLSDTCPDCPDPALCQAEAGCLGQLDCPSDVSLQWDAVE